IWWSLIQTAPATDWIGGYYTTPLIEIKFLECRAIPMDKVRINRWKIVLDFHESSLRTSIAGIVANRDTVRIARSRCPLTDRQAVLRRSLETGQAGRCRRWSRGRCDGRLYGGRSKRRRRCGAAGREKDQS